MKTVVLFGLSANPPTGLGGHMGIIKYFSEQFDEVWVLPVYYHPYSSKRELKPFETRKELLQLSLTDCGLDGRNIYVKECEKDCFKEFFPHFSLSPQNEVKFGTYDLISWLQSKHPDIAFSMIIGEDAFNDICNNKWRNSEELKRMLHFEVIKRKGVDPSGSICSETWYSYHTDLDLGEYLVNGTAARAAIDKEELTRYVTPRVADFITNNHLYAFR